MSSQFFLSTSNNKLYTLSGQNGSGISNIRTENLIFLNDNIDQCASTCDSVYLTARKVILYLIVNFWQEQRTLYQLIVLFLVPMMFIFDDIADLIWKQFWKTLDNELRNVMPIGAMSVSNCNHVNVPFGNVLLH